MNYVVDFMVGLLKIPSPGGDTQEGIEELIKEFKEMGIEALKTKKGSIIAVVKVSMMRTRRWIY
jgi:putative aminopeptidase FrvX